MVTQLSAGAFAESVADHSPTHLTSRQKDLTIFESGTEQIKDEVK
jgi:hypothetical protein